MEEDKLLISFIDNLRNNLGVEKFDGFIGVNRPNDLDSYFASKNKKDEKENLDIRMTVNPIKEFIVDIKNKKLVKIRNKLLEARNYKNFFHFKKITTQNDCASHFKMTELNEEYVLEESDNSNTLKFKNFPECNIEYKIDDQKVELINVSDELYEILVSKEDIETQNKLINLCDFIFFNPGLNEALALPLPFTSVPTMVLITTNKEADSIKFINQIIECNSVTKETRLNFLFNRFVERLSDKSVLSRRTDKQFVEWFLIQISEILLPISYEFTLKEGLYKDSGELFSCLRSDCPEDLNPISFDLKANRNDKENIGLLSLKLKSFASPKGPIDNKALEWFHEIGENDTTQKHIIETIENLFSLLYQKLEEERKNQKKIKKEAIKATVANIVSRGMAHSDASHTMLTFEKNFLKNINVNKDESKVDLNLFYYEKDDFIKYNSHLRNMMDYVADISGGLGQQTLYNYTFNDVFEELKTLFSSSSSISKKILGSGLVDGNGHAVITMSKETQENSMFREMNIAFPGGENGKTALINLLKGFFRNLYKHTNPKTEVIYSGAEPSTIKEYQGQLCLALNQDNKDDYISVELKDISSSYNKVEAKKLVNRINKLLNTKIVDFDETGQHLKTLGTGWGLIEMKISAAYLIRLPIDDFELEPELEKLNSNKSLVDFVRIGDKLYPREFFKAKIHPAQEVGNYNLGFTFYLQRSKLLAYNGNNTTYRNKYEIDYVNSISEEKNNNYKYFLSDISNNKLKSYNFKIINQSDVSEILNNNAKKKTTGLEQNLDKLWLLKFLNHKKKQKLPVFEDYCVTDKDNSTCNSNVVFDNHSALYKTFKKHQSLFDFSYYEYLDSNNYREIFENGKFKSKYHYQLLESINTRVAILDERIQDFSLEMSGRYNEQYSNNDLLSLKGIFVPNLDLDEKNNSSVFSLPKGFESDFENNLSLKSLMYGKHTKEYTPLDSLLKIIDYYLNIKNCDYILLHFSGLEKIVENSYIFLNLEYNQVELNRAYSKLVQYFKNESKYLILISGKGTPINIPNSSFFMSFNNLQYGLGKSKYELVKMLNSVRPLK